MAESSVLLGQRLAQSFKPPFLLSGADTQTVLGALVKGSPQLDQIRKRLDTEDGDFLDLDYLSLPPRKSRHHDTKPLSDASPVALLVHGLGGSSASAYVRFCANDLLRRGVRPVCVNLRGSSGEPNRGQRLYHAAAYEDVLFALERLFDMHPAVSRFSVIGFSLGASITLNLVGRLGDKLDPRLVCAAAVSPPIDLLRGADALENGAGRKWTRYLLTGLRTILKPRLGTFTVPGVDDKAAYDAPTIRMFDEHLIAPLHGFPSANEYYKLASSGPYLKHIARPTLVIRSRDDPFLAPTDVDIPDLKTNPAIVPVLTERGGHIGYVTSKGLGMEAWAEPTVAEWVAGELLRT
ncbi:Alpha/Beta hydrolase protein [Hyaloraphidium curvatum]|nr:Alpha/Beta hydrolase protein [Hyaloraphidium curvatum]